MKETKRISILDCKINDEFDTIIYSDKRFVMGAKYKIKQFTNNFVVCYNFWKQCDEKIPNNVEVYVFLSEDDIKKKYFSKAKEIALALNNKLYDNGGNPHEMWNGWVCCTDPYDMAKICEEEKLNIIGYFNLYEYKKNDLDIGVLAEDSNGNRFWCHAKSMWFERWPDKFPELYK